MSDPINMRDELIGARFLAAGISLARLRESERSSQQCVIYVLDTLIERLPTECRPRVVIEVYRGIASIVSCPDWIEVEIRDLDIQEDDECRSCGNALDATRDPPGNLCCDCYVAPGVHWCNVCQTVVALPNGDLCQGCLNARLLEEGNDEIPF